MVIRIWKKWLMRRTQRHRINWEGEGGGGGGKPSSLLDSCSCLVCERCVGVEEIQRCILFYIIYRLLRRL